MARVKNNGLGGVIVAGTLALALAVGGIFVFNNKEQLAEDLDKVLNLEQELKNSRQELDSLNSQIREKEDLIENLRRTNNVLYARVVELEEAIKDFNAAAIEDLEEIARLNQIIANNEETISNLAIEISELEYTVNYYKGLYEELDEDFAFLNGDYNILQNEHNQLQQDYNALGEAFNSLENDYSALENENSGLAAENVSLNNEKITLSDSLANMTTERDDYKSLYEEYLSKYDELSQSVSSSELGSYQVSIYSASDIKFNSTKYNVNVYILKKHGKLVDTCAVIYYKQGLTGIGVCRDFTFRYNEDGSITCSQFRINSTVAYSVNLLPEDMTAGDGEVLVLKHNYNGALSTTDGSKQYQLSVNFATGILTFYLLNDSNNMLGVCSYRLTTNEYGTLVLGEQIASTVEGLALTSCVFGADNLIDSNIIIEYEGETIEFASNNFAGVGYGVEQLN